MKIMNKPTRTKQGLKARSKGTFPASRLSDRDRHILKLVYEHRFLDTELLWHLTRIEPAEATRYAVGADGKRRPSSYGFGMKALYKRLQQLSDQKLRLLHRHYAYDQPMGRGHGSPRAIYGLGPASSAIVAETAGIPVQEVKDIVSANRVKAPFLRHTLNIARFRVMLELACRESDDRIRLLFWEQGNALQDWIEYREQDEDDGREISVCPDAFFGLDIAGKGKAHYFLEMDRGSMPIVRKSGKSDIKSKVQGYVAYYTAGRHSQRYQYRILPDKTVIGLVVNDQIKKTRAIETNGLQSIKSFRVLFVAEGATNGALTPRGRVANMFSAFPSFGKGFEKSKLFWFASLDSFDLERPETVFDRVWLTPSLERGLKSVIE